MAKASRCVVCGRVFVCTRQHGVGSMNRRHPPPQHARPYQPDDRWPPSDPARPPGARPPRRGPCLCKQDKREQQSGSEETAAARQHFPTVSLTDLASGSPRAPGRCRGWQRIVCWAGCAGEQSTGSAGRQASARRRPSRRPRPPETRRPTCFKPTSRALSHNIHRPTDHEW